MPGRGSGGRASRTVAAVFVRAFAAGALLLASGYAAAQCTVTGSPVNFEPNPPGPAGARPILFLSAGFNSNLALYREGTNGPWRVFMQESFGYSTLDITNRMAPQVLRWDYLPYAANAVTRNGDGQSFISNVAATADGQRVSLGTNGPADPPWHTVVGTPDGASGFLMRADVAPVRATATILQSVAGRYIHYGIDLSTGVYVADVTTPPASWSPLNRASEHPSWAPGVSPTLAGGYLVYPTAAGQVQVVDVKNPGPAGAITGAMPNTTYAPAAFGQAARSISYVRAAVDPSDSSKLWLLVEYYALTGENSPSYGLYWVTESANTFSAPTSAGPLFRVPALAGETWSVTGAGSALATINGTVQVLMWGARRSPNYKAVLYTTTASTWGTFLTTNFADTTFGVNTMAILPDGGNTVYLYVANISNAWVVPLACVAADAKASAVLTATNAATGLEVNDGATLPYGETLAFAAQVLPAPAPGRTDLTGWRWNADLDFHAGNGVEDFGAAATPRLANPDDGYFLNPSYPPAAFTLVGPCDPMAGGNPATGAGCWTSVRTNSAQGGPDFTGAETSASPAKPLVLALEANNTNGSSGPRLFTLNWKVPSVTLASTQLLYGDPLTAVAEGHPSTGGANVWKWWLGPSGNALVQNSCASAACTPAGADAAPGVHSYWVTAPYAQIGYSTPAWAGVAAMGTYTITAFSPAFTVNNVGPAGSVSVSSTQAITVANSSRRGSSTTGNGGYAYCIVPASPGTCAAGDWHLFPSLADPANASTGTPPTYDQVPNPGPGSFVLRLRVAYSNPSGVAYWPDPSGAAGLPVAVFATPTVSASASPNPAESGDTVTFTCSATGGSGTYAYDWSGQFGSVASTPSFQTRVTNHGTTNALYAFDCTVTDAVSGASAAKTVNLTVHPAPPLVASASAGPATVPAGTPGTFTCSATGGSGGYSYVWDFSDGARVAGAVVPHVFAGYGPSFGTCTVTDSTNATSQASASVSVLAPGAGGPYALFVLTPCRILDTRNASGGALGAPTIEAAGSPDRSFPVAGVCGIPTDAKALSVNVTVTNVRATGTLSIYRGDGSRTGATTAAFVAGKDRANNAMLQLALDGSGTVKVQNLALGTLDLIVDVNGYFR